jgi:hypothetical protein
MPCRTCWVSEEHRRGELVSTNHTHAFPGSEQSSDANEEAKECQRSPASIGRAQSNDNGINKAANNTSDTKESRKCLSRLVAIANRPSDKIGVCLMTEGPLDCSNDIAEC